MQCRHQLLQHEAEDPECLLLFEAHRQQEVDDLVEALAVVQSAVAVRVCTENVEKHQNLLLGELLPACPVNVGVDGEEVVQINLVEISTDVLVIVFVQV